MTQQQMQTATKNFSAYFNCQFFGALNDNIYKNCLIMLLAIYNAHTPTKANLLANISAGLFILPFFLFSALAGTMADKFAKHQLIRWIKLMEILIMSLAVIALSFDSIYALILLLFCMGGQSAFFGPLKYSIIPELVKAEKLVNANAWVEGSTFVAIILGTVLGAWLITQTNGKIWVSASLIIIAVAGWLSAIFIPKLPPRNTQLKLSFNFSQFKTILAKNLSNTETRNTIFAISWFWFLGAFMLTQLPNYSIQILGVEPKLTSLFLAIFSVSITIGSFLASRIAKGAINLLISKFALMILSASFIALALSKMQAATSLDLNLDQFLSAPSNLAVLVLLFCLGVAAGLYIVPLYSHLQFKAKEAERAQTIAALNIVNALYMVGAALFAIIGFKLRMNIPGLMLVVGLISLVQAIILKFTY